MYDEKTREKLIRETAESIYQYYPMACKMVICFLSYNNRKVSGYVKSVYYDNRPFYFEGLDHLLLLMEDIMDTTDYPQVTVPVCTGIPEYGYRIYDCGAVLHRSTWRHDAADCSGRPLCG